MKPEHVIQHLRDQGLLAEDRARRLIVYHSDALISLRHELKTLLWLGSTLLIAGLTLAIRDAVSPVMIVSALSLGSVTALVYAQVTKRPMAIGEVESPGIVHDSILMLGCLLLVTLRGYVEQGMGVESAEAEWSTWALQFTLLFLTLAYAHDSRSVLSLGFVGFTAWIGLKVDPDMSFLNDAHDQPTLVWTIIGSSALMIGIGVITARIGLKPHLLSAYVYFFANLALGTATARFFELAPLPGAVPFVAIIVGSMLLLAYGGISKRLVAVLLGVVFPYIAITRYAVDLFESMPEGTMDYMFPLYLIVTATPMVVLLFRARHALRGATA